MITFKSLREGLIINLSHDITPGFWFFEPMRHRCKNVIPPIPLPDYMAGLVPLSRAVYSFEF